MEIKTIGIIGGMGPLAGIDLQRKIILATPAEKDQDHLTIINYSNPHIADRTRAIVSNEANIVPDLVKAVRSLETYNPDVIIIACNTAHAYLSDIQKKCATPLLNIIEITVDSIIKTFPDIITIGVLATTGTVQTGTYTRAIEARGCSVLYPSEETQTACVMPAIYECIKTNKALVRAKKLLDQAIGELISQGAEKIILGCTEVPLLYKENKLLIDPAEQVARYIISQIRN